MCVLFKLLEGDFKRKASYVQRTQNKGSGLLICTFKREGTTAATVLSKRLLLEKEHIRSHNFYHPGNFSVISIHLISVQSQKYLGGNHKFRGE